MCPWWMHRTHVLAQKCSRVFMSILLLQVDQHSCHLPVCSSSCPSLPLRVTWQICKNTLLISRQEWQLPPLTSASQIPSFPPPPPFLFLVFISCSAPEIQIFTHSLCPPLLSICTRSHIGLRESETGTEADQIFGIQVLWGGKCTNTILPVVHSSLNYLED